MSSTWQQQRARWALEMIDAGVLAHHRDTRWLKSFRDTLRSAPTTVQTVGLGTAMTMLAMAGAHTPEHTVYRACQGWLTERVPAYRGKTDLVAALTKGNARDYFLAQAEALAALSWAKMLVETRIDEHGAARYAVPQGTGDAGA